PESETDWARVCCGVDMVACMRDRSVERQGFVNLKAKLGIPIQLSIASVVFYLHFARQFSEIHQMIGHDAVMGVVPFFNFKTSKQMNGVLCHFRVLRNGKIERSL